MKKFTIGMIFTLSIFFIGSAFGWFSKESELNHLMDKIESRLDHCIETQNKSYCTDLIMENPMMEIMGNKKLYKELTKCTAGNKCYATSYRITMKTSKASMIVLGE
jgi:hypothetical protein